MLSDACIARMSSLLETRDPRTIPSTVQVSCQGHKITNTRPTSGRLCQKWGFSTVWIAAKNLARTCSLLSQEGGMAAGDDRSCGGRESDSGSGGKFAIEIVVGNVAARFCEQ